MVLEINAVTESTGLSKRFKFLAFLERSMVSRVEYQRHEGPVVEYNKA